eukprot:gene28203-37107_t
MFLEEEVLRLLELDLGVKDENKREKNEAHRKKIESVLGNLRNSLLYWSKDISPPSNATTALTNEQNKLLIACIGDALRIREDVASALLPEFSAKSKTIEAYTANSKNGELITINEFHTLRNFFFQKRQYGWFIVQDILHMDLDDSHSSHSQASALANDFVNSDFVSNVIKHLRVLHKWTPGSIDSSKFKCFSRNDTASFIHTERMAWAIGVCQEIEAALDVLILISYSHRLVDLNLFKEVVTVFVEHRVDLEHFASAFGIASLDQSNSMANINHCIVNVYFKYMTLFAANFQFWHIFEISVEEDPVQSSHPLLVTSQSSSTSVAGNVETISTTLWNHLRGNASHDLSNSFQLHSQACQLLLFMWAQFLQAFDPQFPTDIKSSTYHEVLHFASSSCGQVSELLLILAGSMSGNRNSMRSTTTILQLNPNNIMCAHIMQEVLNLFIDRVTLSDNSLQDLGVVVSLTEIFYRADLQLCEKFWSMWTSQGSCPLCRLVNALVDHTSHDPVYLLLILNALCSSPMACYKVMELLNRQIQAITKVHYDDVVPLSPIPQSESTLFEGQEIELRRADRSNHRFFLSSPAAGTTGRILQLEGSSETVLVKWTHVSVWWTIMFESVIFVATATSSLNNGEEQKMVSSLVSLLCKFLSQQNLVSGYLLESKWNEIALYSFLSSIGLGEVHPLLAKAGESLARLQGNADDNYHRLINIGLDNEIAQLIVTRAGSSSREGFFYLYSLSELLSYFVCNTLMHIMPPVYLNKSSFSRYIDQGPALGLVANSLELLNSLLGSSVFSISATINVVQGMFYNSRSVSYHEYLTELSCNYSNEFSTALFPVINQQAVQVAKTLHSYSYTHNFWYHAFNEAVRDDDGGLVDREVFVRDVLKKNGCTLPSSVIDHLFQAFAHEGSRISSNHCMLFFAGLDKDSVTAKNWFDITENDLAETNQQLSDLRSKVQLSADGIIKTCTEFGLRYVNVIFAELQYLVKQITAAEASDVHNTGRLHTVLGCVETFEFLLSTLSTEDKYAVCQEYISPNYTFVWEVIIQCSLSFGLLSLQNKHELKQKNVRPSATSFKALFAASRDDRSSATDDSIAIPVDFQPLLPSLSLETTDYLIQLSLKTTELLMLVIDASLRSNCVTALQTLRTILVAGSRWTIAIQGQGLPSKSYHSALAGRTSAIENLNPTTYITVLASLMGISLVHSSNLVRVLKISFTKLFTKAVCMLSSTSAPIDDSTQSVLYFKPSPFISCLDMVNIPGLCAIIYKNVLHEHHTEKETTKILITEAMKRLTTATLSLLLAIGEHQPAAFAALLSVRKDAPRLISTSEDLMIVSMLSTLLQRGEALYVENPLHLYLVLQIVRVMWTDKHQVALTRATLQLIQSPDFWNHLMRPLMNELPDVKGLLQVPSDTLWDAVNSPHNDWDGAQRSLLYAETVVDQNQCMEEEKNSVLAQVKGTEIDVDFACQRILVHSTVLQLLSLERHGLFFEKDIAIATVANKKANAFYVHANKYNRFILWMKQYMSVSSGNPTLARSLEQQATALGVDIESLFQDGCLNINPSTSESGYHSGNNVYGYPSVSHFDFPVLSHVLAQSYGVGLIRTMTRSKVGSAQGSSSNFTAFLFFENSVRWFVQETLIARSQASLVKSWARFIEFYILPGSALMRRTVGTVADPANASEEHKEKSQTPLEQYSSTPIVGGALSPLTSDLHSSSPITMGKSSAFSGDKRSYEVLAELMGSLRDSQPIIEAVSSSIGVFATSVKCQLLLSMLHHQLKDVALKTSDPARSAVYNRDSETTRIRQTKLFAYLEILVFSCGELNKNLTSLAENLSTPVRKAHLLLLRRFYPNLSAEDANMMNYYFSTKSKDLNTANNDNSWSWMDSLNVISVRLFTAMLLIVRTLHHSRTIFDGFENVSSRDDVLFRSVFQLAANTFRTLLQGKTGAGVLAKPADSNNDPNILIRLMQLSLPAKSISIADRNSWNRTLTYPSWGATSTSDSLLTPYSDDIICLTLNLLQKILTSPLLLENPKLSNKDVESESRSTILSSLHGIVDLLTAYIDCAVLEKDKIGHLGSQVLAIVLNSEIFTAYQRIILSNREQNCAAIYYDDEGEESSASACWRRVMTLVSVIITTIDYDNLNLSSEGQPYRPNLTNLVCQFFNDFKVSWPL